MNPVVLGLALSAYSFKVDRALYRELPGRCVESCPGDTGESGDVLLELGRTIESSDAFYAKGGLHRLLRFD